LENSFVVLKEMVLKKNFSLLMSSEEREIVVLLDALLEFSTKNLHF